MKDEIFRTIAGSRLYGTHTANSDTDYKAVHLPTKREILLGRRKEVISYSTGPMDDRNDADDVDLETFELQRFLQLAADMQTIPVEMLFVVDGWGSAHFNCAGKQFSTKIWREIIKNRDKILNRNSKAFVGYCKGQAIRYSMRGKRLETYEAVCSQLRFNSAGSLRVSDIRDRLEAIPNVVFVDRVQPDGAMLPYLDVYGRQCPITIKVSEALSIYHKPVLEAGKRARDAMDAGGMDCKALYHAVRIADQGIRLFQTGKIEFPCQNLPILMRIRNGEVEIDEILDIFDEKLQILSEIGENSPLSAEPDRKWIDDFVVEVYEGIVRG